MKLALSTNWCNRRLATGEEIADKAFELGFDELELGFHTTPEQVPGFRARLGTMPVGSVHAFCPVPLSAPQGYPELYALADADDEARKMAALQVRRTVAFASDMGADTVVLHAGRVKLGTWWRPLDTSDLRAARAAAGGDVTARAYAKLVARARKNRRANGRRTLDVFRRELDALVPELECRHVTLALENMPYLEGFPDEEEMEEIVAAMPGAPVRAWFDTGHHRVRACHGWLAKDYPDVPTDPSAYAGLHLNDVVDFDDDHLAPGDGKVDFAALAPFARAVTHRVFEPAASVSEECLRAALARIRACW